MFWFCQRPLCRGYMFRFWGLGNLSELCLVLAYILTQCFDDPLHMPRADDNPGSHDSLWWDYIDEVDEEFLLAVRNDHVVCIGPFQDLVRNLDPHLLGFLFFGHSSLLVIIDTASDWILWMACSCTIITVREIV